MKTLKSVLLVASLFAAGAAWAGAIIHERATDEKGRSVELRFEDGKVTGPKGEKVSDGRYEFSWGVKFDVKSGRTAVDPNMKPGAAISAEGKAGETRGVIIPNYKNANSASDGKSTGK